MNSFFGHGNLTRCIVYVWFFVDVRTVTAIGIKIAYAGASRLAILVFNVGNDPRKVQRFVRVENLKTRSLMYHRGRCR
jgi:hypothetical protein